VKAVAILLLIAAIVGGILIACATTQPVPGAPRHHTTSGFQNPPDSPTRNPWYERIGWVLAAPFRLSGQPELPESLSHVRPKAATLDTVRDDRTPYKITWIGHMTVLLQLGDITILTDPWLSEYASPVAPIGPKRFVEPALDFTDLPPIDVVVLSHNHYDHMDLDTLANLPDRDRITAIAPLKLGRYFRDYGYDQVIELDWYQSTDLGALTVTALPAIHWSKRSLLASNDTLWASYALTVKDGPRIYFGGDADYGPIYSQLAARHGGFDLAILAIGAYLPRRVMQGSHCEPRNCLRIGLDLEATNILGIHWGTVKLGDDHPLDAPKLLRQAAVQRGLGEDRVWVMDIGETRAIPAAIGQARPLQTLRPPANLRSDLKMKE